MAGKPAKKIAEKPAVVLKPDDEIKELSNTETPEELTKMIDGAPPEIKRVLSQVFSMEVSRRQVGGLPLKLYESVADKITDKHIDKILDNGNKSDSRQFIFSILVQLRNVIFVSAFIVFFIWFTIFLAKDKEALYLDIIKTLLAFLGGLGFGFGIKSYQQRDK